MPTKLKELCDKFPKVARQMSPLDQVATAVFYTDWSREYVHSIDTPVSRYGIELQRSQSAHYNRYIPDFGSFGPNEQFLINKIFFSPSPLLYVVGGLGVGKTRFVRFFMNEVAPQIVHSHGQEFDRCPCPIYLDFLEDAPITDEDSDAIKAAFLTSFCDRLEAELLDKQFFTLEEEVGYVWEELIKQYSGHFHKPSALTFILARLRSEDATMHFLQKSYEVVISKRKAIRRVMMEDLARRESYIAMLMKYVQGRYFKAHPGCLTIIIDNVDRETSLTQQQVKMALKPFARASGVRTIINTRQTTYYQAFDDGVSDPYDRVPYCGPDPVIVVLRRLEHFLACPELYTEHYSPELLPKLIAGTEKVRAQLEKESRLHLLMSALCGRSIRISLILAQRLIDNSVYDPAQDHDFTATEMDRALLVGAADTFISSPHNVVENIFEVSDHPTGSYFIKLRILRALRQAGGEGLRINRLIDLMSWFEYDLQLVCSAINDMKREQKRLLWSDSLKGEFKDETDLVAYGRSRIIISSVGEGYDELVPYTLSYLQEVMLDTAVDSHEFGSGWDYRSLEGRFTLIQKFLRLLHEQDVQEMRKCMSNSNPSEYQKAFGNRQILSTSLIRGIRSHVDTILGAINVRSSRREFEEFHTQHIQTYDDQLVRAENFQEQIFS